MSERVATVDIGTNTVLLLVAEAAGGARGELVAVEEHATITRLGEGVDRTRTLGEEAIARTCACLDRYADIAARAGVRRTAVVGTSAMRDARGGERIAEHVRRRFGVELEIVAGEREAQLTFVGSLVGLPRGEGTPPCSTSAAGARDRLRRSRAGKARAHRVRA